jgi:hypothetical protein
MKRIIASIFTNGKSFLQEFCIFFLQAVK